MTLKLADNLKIVLDFTEVRCDNITHFSNTYSFSKGA